MKFTFDRDSMLKEVSIAQEIISTKMQIQFFQTFSSMFRTIGF